MAGVEVIETVLRPDEWTALPPGFGHVGLRPADAGVAILAHIGQVDAPPTLAETLVFVCPVVLSLKALAPDRTVYLRTKAGSLPVRIDLAPVGADLTQFGPSPFARPEDGSTVYAPFTLTR